MPWALLLALGAVGIVWKATQQPSQQNLPAGRLRLTFAAPVATSKLQVVFSNVTPLDTTNTRYEVTVDQAGTYQLPGLTEAARA